MKTKSIILLVLIASAMIQVFVYFLFVFVFVLILAMIQNQALVASKHYLVETESEKLADNAVDISAKGGQTEYGGRLMDKDQRLFFLFQIFYLTTVCVVVFNLRCPGSSDYMTVAESRARGCRGGSNSF